MNHKKINLFRMTILGREQVYLFLIKENVKIKYNFERGKSKFLNIRLMILN